MLRPPGGGTLRHEMASSGPLRIAVLTISDTRDEESDTSGQLLVDRRHPRRSCAGGRGMVKDDIGRSATGEGLDR